MTTALFVIACCLLPVAALLLIARRAYVRSKLRARLDDAIWICPKCLNRMESRVKHVCGGRAA